MTVPPAMLPGSRTLLAWWRDLAACRPRRLWFTHLRLHHLEALVEVAHSRRLDRLPRTLLHALSLQPSAGANGCSAPPLGALHLDPQVLGRLLRELAGEGLIEAEAGGWVLTARGRQALADGTFVVPGRERRAFHFLDNGAVGRPPHFLALREAPAVPCDPGEGWQFDAALLEACVRQPPEWKSRHGFPADVLSVHGVGARPAPHWREVILDRPEQLRLAVVEAVDEAGGQAFLGFAVKPEGWDVERDHPALVLGEGAAEALPDLTDPGPEVWRQAWQHWCHPRGIPPAEVDACQLERTGHQLVVRAPKRLVDRLRAARSDALKHEAWLLASDGRTRAAAEIEMIDAG